MKKNFILTLVLLLVLELLSSPVCVQAKSNPKYTTIKMSGTFDPSYSGKEGLKKLNKVRSKAHKSEVIYSPALEKAARSMVAAYIVAGKTSEGRLKSPKTKKQYDVASLCRKNIDPYSSIGFLSYAYSCNVSSKDADVAAMVSGHSTRYSPGIYGSYRYGACVKFIPEGSKKAYFVTLLCSQKGSSVKIPTKQKETLKIKIDKSYISKGKKSSSGKNGAPDKGSLTTLKCAYEKLKVKVKK